MARKPTGQGRTPTGEGREPPTPPYEIGFGKPPKSSQFKPGQSGNPAARPKGRKNFLTEFDEERNELVEILAKGRKIDVSKQRALIKTAFAKAAGGDVRMLAMIFNLSLTADIHRNPAAEPDTDPGDQAIIDRFIADLVARQLRSEEPPND